ncbi:MAG: TetR family transcriptional regulator [Rhodocyclaceae bacterium]|nr:TetR family transcriptional regulator [Rhodocyclaceae bacterium]
MAASIPVEYAPVPDTRTRILDAAEALFAARGFEATTMRMITSAAQANLASVNYHFGAKESLIEEVFRRRLGAITARMLARLDELERASDSGVIRPSKIVEAFFGEAICAAADEARGGKVFMRLFGRTLTEPNEFVRNFLKREYAIAVERYKQALFRALPGVSPEEIVWRLHFMLGATAHAIAGADALNLLGDEMIAAADADTLYARLMSFLLGGLRAPLPLTGANNVSSAPATPKAASSKRDG